MNPQEIITKLLSPKETISRCRKLLYVDKDVAEEAARLIEKLLSCKDMTGDNVRQKDGEIWWVDEDGCSNDAAGNECNCWARSNQEIEDLFNKLEEQISTKGKPVVWAVFTPRGFYSSSDDILIAEDMQRKLRQFDIDAIIKPLGFIEESKTNES
jgi:hypothetical protein